MYHYSVCMCARGRLEGIWRERQAIAQRMLRLDVLERECNEQISKTVVSSVDEQC